MTPQEKLKLIEKTYNELFYKEGFIDANYSWLIARVKKLESAIENHGGYIDHALNCYKAACKQKVAWEKLKPSASRLMKALEDDSE